MFFERPWIERAELAAKKSEDPRKFYCALVIHLKSEFSLGISTNDQCIWTSDLDAIKSVIELIKERLRGFDSREQAEIADEIIDHFGGVEKYYQSNRRPIILPRTM